MIYRYLLKHREFGNLTEKHQSIIAQRLLGDSWESKFELNTGELLDALLTKLTEASCEAQGNIPIYMENTKYFEWMKLFKTEITNKIEILYQKKLIKVLIAMKFDPIKDNEKIFASLTQIIKHKYAGEDYYNNENMLKTFTKTILETNLVHLEKLISIEPIKNFKQLVSKYPLSDIISLKSFQSIFSSFYSKLLPKLHAPCKAKYLSEWSKIITDNRAYGCDFFDFKVLPEILIGHFSVFRPIESNFEYFKILTKSLMNLVVKFKKLDWISCIYSYLVYFCEQIHRNCYPINLTAVCTDILRITKSQICNYYPGFYIYLQPSAIIKSQVEQKDDVKKEFRFDLTKPITLQIDPNLHRLLHYVSYLEEREGMTLESNSNDPLTLCTCVKTPIPFFIMDRYL